MVFILKRVGIFFILFISFFAFFQQPAEASGDQLIIINKSTNKLAFFDDGKLIKVFNVATGRRDSYTPEGKFKIVNKIKNRPYYKENIPGGDPRNPLGDRWLGLDARGTYGTTYAIHGNSNESSIGKYVSSGCVRLHNNEVRWLFGQLNLYTTVIITDSGASFEKLAVEHGYLDQNLLNKQLAEKAGSKLLSELSAYNSAINSGSISKINSLYDRLTSQLKATELATGKVSGKSNREILEAKYIRPSKIAIERTIYEVSQYRLLNDVGVLISKNKISTAEDQLSKLERLKKRSIAIKKAGNYKALPANVDRSLLALKATNEGNIMNTTLAQFNQTISAGKIGTINSQYDSFTKKLRATEIAIGQVYGSTNRNNLGDMYITPSKVAVERVIYEVSIYRLLNEIYWLLDDNKLNQARNEFSTLDRLKRRAIEIKKNGGYQSVPDSISRSLSSFENRLKTQVK